MATSAASYRNPQSKLTLELSTEQIPRPHTLGQVCRDLEELCEMGILEAFIDMYGIVRYRPTHAGAQ